MATIAELPEAASSATGYLAVAARVCDWARAHPGYIAMREKDFGIWHEITWADAWDRVLTAAHGLLALGVSPGEVVSIHSEDRPEWVILDLA
jgi:long-chain acyl-CoA synthetase